MRRDGFEIEISQISKVKGFVFFTVLILVLIVNSIIILSKDKDKVTYAYHDESIGMIDNEPIVSIIKTDDQITAKKGETDTIGDLIWSYKCVNKNCYIYDLNKDTNEVILYDNSIFIYNYENNSQKALNINFNESLDIKYLNNILYVKNNNKYALFDINNNTYLTEFLYDGISLNKYSNITNSLYSLYTNNSKYNQTLDIYDSNNSIIKHMDYCVGYNNIQTGLCSEHIKGIKTNEEVDQLLDLIVNKYPNINNNRLLIIKTALETYGLPYSSISNPSLDNIINIAINTWNIEGLDNSQFIRWLIYICADVDAQKEGRDIAYNKNPNYKQINEEELLPGDIIISNNQVGLFLYKDDEGMHIVINESIDSNKVDIINYDSNNQYFRIGVWK